MLILGLDPGLRHTGWGLVEASGNQLRFVACGTVHTDAAMDLAGRLGALYRGLGQVIDGHLPKEAAVEETVVNRNPLSSLKLGHARGVVLLVASHAGLGVHEYAAKQVKRAVTGTGNAAKEQVAMMVRFLLPGSGGVVADAADALAVAICHAHFRTGRAQIAAQMQRDAVRGLVIAHLRGILAGIGEDQAIIDVAGVGYLVTVAPATLEQLPRVGEAVELHTELQVREDGMTLYGFPDPADRTWFRLLQTVQGVGARVALSLLGTLRPHELANAIAAGDKAMLARATGVGGRLAARIASELKDRVGALPQPGRVDGPAVALGGASGDALSALLHLGYGRAEAYAALARAHARLGAEVAVDALVREGLKELTA